jgi:hypothetical protein
MMIQKNEHWESKKSCERRESRKVKKNNLYIYICESDIYTTKLGILI